MWGCHLLKPWSVIFFNEFLRDVELDDLNLLGRRYTWYHSNGIAMSRIDRVLVSEEWTQFWGPSSLWVLPDDISDHCPLVLKIDGWDWGPRPFRFNNFWLENNKFKGVVEGIWRSCNSSGWMSFVLKEKLRLLKFHLKEWHKGEYGEMDGRLDILVVEIADLDVKGEGGELSGEEVQRRKALFGEMWRILKAKRALTVQRSKSKWLREGDANLIFFSS